MSMSNQRKIIDSRGSFCPGPITDLFKAYRQASVGDELELWATDPAAKADVTAWAKKSGNEILEVADAPGHIRIAVRIVRKGK